MRQEICFENETASIGGLSVVGNVRKKKKSLVPLHEQISISLNYPLLTFQPSREMLLRSVLFVITCTVLAVGDAAEESGLISGLRRLIGISFSL